MTIYDEFERCRAAIEAVTGEALDVDRPRRTECQFWMRAIIADTLFMKGWSDERIAGILGRNRTTIIHCRHKLREAMDLPKVYWDIMKEIKSFKDKYYEFFGQNI